MSYRTGTLVVAVSFSLLISIGSLSITSNSARAQTTGATVESSVLFIMQGENDIVTGTLSDHDFYGLKIVTYNLPYDVTRVYTVIPATATNINLWTPSGEINQTSQGQVTSGEHAGQFFLDVPSTHARTANYTNLTSSEAGFNASGSEHLNTTYSNGSLRLANGLDSGQYLSPVFPVAGAHTISSTTLAFQGNSTSNVTSWVSNDGGGTWISCQDSTQVDFLTSGSSVRVRFDFDGNASAGFEPNITSFQVSARYVLEQTLFTIHVSYLWTEHFPERKAVLNVSEAMPFSENGTYYLMLYLVKGYTAQGTGLNLDFDEDGTLGTYPDKAFYYNSSRPGEQVTGFTVEVLAPAEENQTILYAVPVILLICLVLAFAFARWRRKAQRPKSEETLEELPASEGYSAEADQQRKGELIARKKAMLAEIEEIKGKISAREITKEEAERELARLKKESKSVRNELNRISKRMEAVSQVDTARNIEESAGDYDSILASLARIDEDFERDRLPESVYKSLRKDYVSKAAAAIAARKAGPPEVPSPGGAEKTKLIEAIVALDEERERGEIDEKVYSDLRAAYRKQLIELMKKSGRSEE